MTHKNRIINSVDCLLASCWRKLSLEERDGRTTVRTHSVYQSLEARDAVVESGMAGGMNEGFNRLDILLGRLVPVA